jgi:diguanylate cyclase (GGDEF)-like protein
VKETGTNVRPPGAVAAPGSSPALLVVVSAPEPSMLGRRLQLKAEVVLGRDADCCDLVLGLDDVSRRHARVIPDGGGHAVEDLGSTNGTWVGRERVTRRPLASGDLVTVGSAVLKYLGTGDPESAYHDVMARMARQDPLTGLANRAGFDEALAREWARGGRRPAALGLLAIDVDHFKRVNDRHGHAAGDAVLKDLTGLLAGLLRPDALLARVGGEELAVLLPDADLSAALALGERLRAAVEAHPFRFDGAEIPLTISAGAAARAPADRDAGQLLARADALLYQAKRGGRNRVKGQRVP